jgi:hypothetical protein
MTADPVDPGRLNLFERWESQAAVDAFRKRAPRRKNPAPVLSGSVAEYDVSGVRPLLDKKR